MNFRKITPEVAILLLLWISIGVSIYLNPIFPYQFMLGIIAAAMSSVTLVRYHNFSTVILAISLLLSVFGLVDFSVAFGLFFGPVNIPSLILFAILLYMRFDILKDVFSADGQAVDEAPSNAQVEYFKKQFAGLSVSQINSKLANNGLVADAEKALLELKKEKEEVN